MEKPHLQHRNRFKMPDFCLIGSLLKKAAPRQIEEQNPGVNNNVKSVQKWYLPNPGCGYLGRTAACPSCPQCPPCPQYPFTARYKRSRIDNWLFSVALQWKPSFAFAMSHPYRVQFRREAPPRAARAFSAACPGLICFALSALLPLCGQGC